MFALLDRVSAALADVFGERRPPVGEFTVPTEDPLGLGRTSILDADHAPSSRDPTRFCDVEEAQRVGAPERTREESELRHATHVSRR